MLPAPCTKHSCATKPPRHATRSRLYRRTSRTELGTSNAVASDQKRKGGDSAGNNRGRPPVGDGVEGGPGGAPRDGGSPSEPGLSAPAGAGGRGPSAAGPVLDATAREKLVKQAAGKSTREVQQMLAEVDPELAQASDRMRALGNGRWELKAGVDAECRHGLEKLQMLLSHTDPHLTLGGLVARLVRDGLDRYDPGRPWRARRPGGRASVNCERPASTPARRDTDIKMLDFLANEAVRRSAARAQGGAVERRNEVHRDDASLASDRDGRLGPSAPECQSEAKLGRASRAVARGSGGRAASLPKRQGRADGDGRGARVGGVLGRATYAAGLHFEAGERSVSRAPVRGRHRFTSSAAKRLEYAAGVGAVGPVGRSPAVERHLAELSCFGALRGSRSRHIPAAVRREVWRRDGGCCSYVDRHSGRRCGSRYRLEIDHIVPFALGGGAEPDNSRLHCGAHHRLRNVSAMPTL